MSRDIVKVAPSRICWKMSADLKEPVTPDRWSQMQPVTETDKYRSVVMRYVEGTGWAETPLFDNIYRVRLAAGDVIRGSETWAHLLNQYHTRVDAMFADMKAQGFRDEPFPVALCADGSMAIGNQGNHRLAMAAVLNLPYVIVEIAVRESDERVVFDPESQLSPELPACAQDIPAMTTDAERRCYFRLARQQARMGAVVELGPWLGASTAYIAAGVRDAGVKTKAQVYDRFVWKPASHDKKAGGPIETSQLAAFNRNLGPLLAQVNARTCDMKHLSWSGGSVSLLVCDAPKRIPEISQVLSAFAGSMSAGSLMVWQDFAYFPSYDIPAAISRLGNHLEFVEAVYPGTTAIFKVTKPWTRDQVSLSALALNRWTADEIESTWDRWAERLPEPMRPRFSCGAAMFLCDLGAKERGKRRLVDIIATHGEAVLPKWKYLLEERGGLMAKYGPLMDVVTACA